MEQLALVAPEDISWIKEVLRAAAMTYIAALAVAVANLLRILAIRGRVIEYGCQPENSL